MCFYKTICFGKFDSLSNALHATALQKYMKIPKKPVQRTKMWSYLHPNSVLNRPLVDKLLNIFFIFVCEELRRKGNTVLADFVGSTEVN